MWFWVGERWFRAGLGLVFGIRDVGFRRASARILANPKKRSAKRVGSCPMFACLQQEAPGGTHIFGFRASRSAYNWRTVCASCGQLLCCRQSPNFNNVFQGSGFFLGLLREQTWNVRCQSPKNDCFPMCITAEKGYGLIAPLGLCIETDLGKSKGVLRSFLWTVFAATGILSGVGGKFLSGFASAARVAEPRVDDFGAWLAERGTVK